MPRKEYLGTLKHLCILNVARHMEYWCEDYTKYFHDQGNFLHVLGPFDVLTAEHIQDLINVLAQKKLMKRHYLHILIENVLERLDLSVCGNIANKDTVIGLITVRCQRMKHLNLARLNQVSARVLHDLIAAIPLITTLNLKQTRCDDQVLAKIGNLCWNLQDLNISGCPVSDNGIVNLCGNCEEQVKKCECLVRIDVTNTAVTIKGIQYILKNIPHIKFLLFADLCDAIYGIFESRQNDSSPNELLNLRYLSIQQMKASFAPVVPSIEMSCRQCPFVTEIHFLRGVSSEGVLALSVLKHIQILHLANCEEQLITFESGVLPFLQSSGSSIEELFLNEINQVDLSCIGVCCPKLKKFQYLISSFENADFLMHSHPELLSGVKLFFKNLEDLKILLHTPENNFSDMIMRTLIVDSKALRTVHFTNLSILNDSILREILQANPLSNLEELKLESCNHITAEAIWDIVQGSNNLCNLSLLYCFEISRSDYHEIQNYCLNNNYEVQIAWE